MIHVSDKTLAEPIQVVGVQIRTNNASELSNEGQISPLWGRFLSENLAAHIPNRENQSLFAVYSNYATDENGTENGEYDYLLGCAVTATDSIPEGMASVTIPAGNYASFTTDTGPVAEVVQAAWKHIWRLEPNELGRPRAFQTDYEVYDHRALDPQNSQVEIQIGLKPAN